MITVVTIIIAGLGILLLLIMAMQIHLGYTARCLKKHRAGSAGFCDLLNYAALVEDGVIVGKNGSLMAAWLYRGEDNHSSTDKQREMVSFRINQALSGLGNGWMLHVDAVRRAAAGYPEPGLSNFPDPVSAAIDAERRRLFDSLGTMYEGHFVLTATYFPPRLAQRRLAELMFDDDAADPIRQGDSRSLVHHFNRECLNLESRLSAALKLTRLRGRKVINEDGTTTTMDEFLRWLQFCCTGLNHPVRLPACPIYLDALIGGQELFGGVVPKIGRNFIQIVAIEGFPPESAPGLLSALAEQPCEYRWSSRFIFMDSHEALAELEKYRKKWRQKIRGFFDQVFNTSTGPIDQDAQSMVADAELALAETSSGLVAQGYYTGLVVLMNEQREQLDKAVRSLEKVINRLGFAARTETINTLDAFLGSLPGHGVENVRRPLLNTMNLADLLPVSSIWTGSHSAPCPHYPPQAPPLMHCVTQGATPFRFNLHVRDLGHTLIFGPTRAGKSTHLGMIALQLLRYQSMSIYVFDKGLSMYPVTRAVGGHHYMVGAGSSRLAFCPLQFLASRNEQAWALEWLDTLLKLNGVLTTPTQRNALGNALANMHDSGARTLSEFTLTVQDEAIREALRPYTVDGMMGHLLDAEQDGLALSRFTTFEIEELMNLGEKYALPVLLYLFRRIETSLTGQPAIIMLDEAWIMLGHPVFRDKIREWLKAFAKKNCLVLLSTQSLSDVANSGILDVIVESTATKIFLPNIHARDEDTAALYHRMGLNDRQIEILASAIPKRQYYCVSEAGHRLYELALGPLAMALVGVTDKESLFAMQRLEATHGDNWIHAWLAGRGLKLNDHGVTL